MRRVPLKQSRGIASAFLLMRHLICRCPLPTNPNPSRQEAVPCHFRVQRGSMSAATDQNSSPALHFHVDFAPTAASRLYVQVGLQLRSPGRGAAAPTCLCSATWRRLRARVPQGGARLAAQVDSTPVGEDGATFCWPLMRRWVLMCPLCMCRAAVWARQLDPLAQVAAARPSVVHESRLQLIAIGQWGALRA